MHYTFQYGDVNTIKSDCLILGVFEENTFPTSTKQIDQMTGGTLTQLYKQGDISGKVGQALMLYCLPSLRGTRVLVVGCGKQAELNDQVFRKIIAKAITTLSSSGLQEACCCFTELPVKERDEYWKIRQIVEVSEDSFYIFTDLKSNKDSAAKKIETLTLWVKDQHCATVDNSQLEKAVLEAMAIAEGKKITRDLANLPGNICTPTYLADQAEALAKRHKLIRTEVYEESHMKKWGMGALLSVAKGSEEPAKLVTMEYRGGAKTQKPIVFVGKGITFDSGGISIKGAAAMDEMKFDMCGAASILGTMHTLAKLNLPLNVVGVFAASENLPSGSASKPGDIVTTMSGQTVEILNTDAEGRLVLCDALTFCERFEPEVVIDVATLTSACIIALGNHVSALMCNDEALSKALMQASNYASDRLWQMPLWEEYQESLVSNFADIANVGAREGGALIAASYLSRFTKKYRWAHIDIAGTAWKSGKEKGATGRPVSLLVQYLLDRC